MKGLKEVIEFRNGNSFILYGLKEISSLRLVFKDNSDVIKVASHKESMYMT